MVYYFKSNVVEPAAYIYVGKDKFENEELIKFGLENDVWYFHVDNLSSAHVYVRLREGEQWDKIEQLLLEDCAQLTKANSIEGNKKDNITIIYTPWSNLKKDGSMAAGQVTFHNQKLVRKIHVKQRENPIVNRLNKTREEKFPDLRAEKEQYVQKKQRGDHDAQKKRREKEKAEQREHEQKKWEKDHAYDEMFDEENMVPNDQGWESDDFM